MIDVEAEERNLYLPGCNMNLSQVRCYQKAGTLFTNLIWEKTESTFGGMKVAHF